MAFKTVLKIGSKTWSIQNLSYAFRRDTDAKGKPSSSIYGGTVDLVLETTEDTTILESMLNSPTKALVVTMEISKATGEGTQKTITLTDCYVVGFSESISVFGGESMSYNVSFSARKIEVDKAVLENDWPKVAGAA